MRWVSLSLLPGDARKSASFEKYGPLVYRRARILKNPEQAQEATQEVFIKAFQAAELDGRQGDDVALSDNNESLPQSATRPGPARALAAARRVTRPPTFKQPTMVLCYGNCFEAAPDRARAAVYAILTVRVIKMPLSFSIYHAAVSKSPRAIQSMGPQTPGGTT